MGGAGSGGTGGFNSGAGGRPTKSLEDRVLAGTATKAQRAAYDAQQKQIEEIQTRGPDAYVTPPASMPKAAKRFWSELAPHAIAAHTLTSATARAFQELCETMALRREFERRIRAEGWTVKTGKGRYSPRKKHPLVGDLLQLMKDESVGLIRFKLGPLGKAMDYVDPLPATGPVPEVDPFDEFDQKAAAAAHDEDDGGSDGADRTH